ncbi:BnaC08g49910D [Brassica napus]|uniref:BnaC08g49910D protein n=1 Tax=Brassica napus TaxID=3708 RepID=A0A078IY09_BRANA|nr:BnaC08g49910D [Brassica napus]
MGVVEDVKKPKRYRWLQILPELVHMLQQ